VSASIPGTLEELHDSDDAHGGKVQIHSLTREESSGPSE